MFMLSPATATCRKDYYDVLQVPKGAPDSLIKRSYRKLALQYHPVSIRRGPRPAAGVLTLLLVLTYAGVQLDSQDKVKGTDEEKEAAAKRFAEISHGVLHACALQMPSGSR